MGRSKRDYDFTVQLFNGFFSQKRIQKRLNIIKDKGITGWEIWWQIEFAAYLSTKDKTVSEWYREWQYPMDKRKSLQNKMSIDFLIRQKGAKKDMFIALELKQHFYTKSCIRKMLKDTDKVFSICESTSDLRSFWNVGIHLEKNMTDREIEEAILNYIDTDESYIVTEKIGDTGFYYTIF